MPNGFLNISHNFPNELAYVIVEWVKSTAQGTPVVGHVTGTGLGVQNDTNATEVYYPAPHVNEQLQVINISEAWHLVRFWRSSDGISKDLMLLELAGNARTGALYPIERYEYVVNRNYSNETPVVTEGIWSDPVDNATGIRDTRLFEKSFWVEERGTGSLLDSEIIKRDDEGGGFDFANPAKIMYDGGVYIVYAINKVEASGEDSGIVISDDLGIYVLSEDENYNPVTMGGRTIIADGTDPILTLTLLNLLLQPDGKFRLQTHGGLQRNTVIQLDAGDTIKFNGDNVNKIVLGQGEEIEIAIKDNEYHVIDDDTGYKKLGLFIYGYRQAPNTMIADGTLRTLADWPRVEQLLDKLAASSVVSETLWNTSAIVDGQTTYPNKGKWMREGANFRPPDLRDKSPKALSAVDGSIAAGRYEHQAIMSHKHRMRGSFAYGGYDGGGNGFWRIRNIGDPYASDDIMENTGSTNNIVNNHGFFPLLFI